VRFEFVASVGAAHSSEESVACPVDCACDWRRERDLSARVRSGPIVPRCHVEALPRHVRRVSAHAQQMFCSLKKFMYTRVNMNF
jgi:hypothetical protein